MSSEAGAAGGFDPRAVQTRVDLAVALESLRKSRSLSLERMARLSERLPGNAVRLPRSTVSDIVNGKSLPSPETVLAFVRVCEVPAADHEEWLAARDRAATAHLPRPASAVRVRDADPRLLGVHAAIAVDGQVGDRPPYVRRDVDDTIDELVAAAADRGGFLLLMGGSSVGKTRTLFEALRSRLPDWWLLHPAGAADLGALLQSHPARTVVWLDELQRYLDGPDRLTAATLRALISARVVVAGTIWPREYDARMNSTEPDDKVIDNTALLDLATTVVITESFSAAEVARANELADADERLRIALSAGDAGVAQILAAGPDLLRRWEHATDPYGQAAITAVLDARRLGMQAPVTRDHLAHAVPGYLTAAHRADAAIDWLERALAYATVKVRGAAAALQPTGDSMGQTRGYIAADFLLQRSFDTRRAAVPPDLAWQAMIDHAQDPTDVHRLAHSADTRWRLAHATRLYRKLSEAGDEAAARRLAEIVEATNREQAIDVLRPLAPTPHVAGQLVDLMEVADDIDGLRHVARGGDLVAGCRLVAILVVTDVAEVRAAAAAGDWLANGQLLDHDGGDAHQEQLRERAKAGDRLARGRLAELLADRGHLDDAVNVLAIDADLDDRLAGYHLADLLLRHGRIDDLHARADGGDPAAESALEDPGVRGGHIALRIAGALADIGEQDVAIAVLESHADATVELAEEYLIELWVTLDRIDLLEARAATGEWSSNSRLADLVADRGDIARLQEMDAGGNWFATRRLVDLMRSKGQLQEAIDHVKSRVAAGDDLAATSLPQLLAEAEREEDLHDLAKTDPWYASGAWAAYLAERDRLDEAIQWLAEQRGPGEDLATSDLADLLVGQGRIDEALDLLRRFTPGLGDGPSVYRLVSLLGEYDRVDDLRVEVNAGASGAMEQLLKLLLRHDTITIDDVDRTHRHGVTAAWPEDGTPP